MDNFEKQYCETMTKISSNMDKIANSISDVILNNILTIIYHLSIIIHSSYHYQV